MERILIIGSSGSGKTTLSKILGKSLDLPIIHLDSHFWRPNWTEPNSETWQSQVNSLVKKSKWVMEGCYIKSLHQRISHADTIIFMDLPRIICLWRCIKRYVTYRKQVRAELPEGCYEKLDWDFLKWIWNFPNSKKPIIYTLFESLRPDKNLIIIHNENDLKKLLNLVS